MTRTRAPHGTPRDTVSPVQPEAAANGEGDEDEEGDRQPPPRPPAPHHPEPPIREDVPEVPDQREPNPEE